ncbi:MAG: hypothetical protein AAF363_04825 [Bacteroidota bacterium]
MNDFIFWKNWNASEKRIYGFLILLFSINSLIYLIAYIKGIDWVIPTHLIASLREKEYIFSTFKKGLFSFSLEADAYIVFQYFEGGELIVPEWIIHVYLVILALCFSFSLTIISFLNRFWYLILTALTIAFLVFLKLEQLDVFGWGQRNTLIAVFILFVPCSYYFNSFNKNIPFLNRLIIYFILTTVFCLGVLYGSTVDKPFIFLANYGLIGPLVITLLFIFITAHEILATFLGIVTYSSTTASAKTLVQFLAISLFYLVNVALVYFKNTGKIDWGIIYFDEFLILFICAIFGVWGYKKKSDLYEEILPFRPLGAYTYLTLGILSFAFLAYIFATANDPLQETFEDAIIYSQLGCGVMFLIYIIANFSGVITTNLKVSRVLYKPKYMPFFTFRFASIISILGLFYYSSQTPLYQAIAGYNNGIADTYKSISEDFTAKIYYEKASNFAFTNHHSNYAAATMLYSSSRMEALENYREALQKNPSEYAYLNLANHFLRNDKFFDALFILNEGLEKFPESELIKNNLGFAYSKSSVTDSSTYYFNEIYENNPGSPTFQANLIGINALRRVSASAHIENPETDFYVVGNHLSKTLFNDDQELNPKNQERLLFEIEEGTFNFGKLSFLQNLILSGKSNDSLTSSLDTLKKYNEWSEPYLNYASALNDYQHENMTGSIKSLLLLADTPNRGKSAYYRNLLGLVCLENDAFIQAATYFRSALNRGFESEFNLAYTLAELKDTTNSITLLDSLITTEKPGNDGLELLKRTLLNPNLEYALNLDDNEKYQWTRIWGNSYDLQDLEKLFNSFHSSDYEAEALLGLKTKWSYHEQKALLPLFENLRAENDLSSLQKDKLSIEMALLLINDSELFSEEDFPLDDLFKNSLLKEHFKKIELIRLWQNHLNNPDSDLSAKFKSISIKQPFFEEAVILANDYFSAKEEPYLGYEILLNAISINLYSPVLLEKYIYTCGQLNLDSSAKIALDRLNPLVNNDRYETILTRYDSISQSYQNIEF